MRGGRNRFLLLDAFRFVAATAVLLFHYSFYGVHMGRLPCSEVSGFELGFLGVDLFFVVSGVVIYASAKGRGASEFFVSRASRILPVYWLSLTITFLILFFFGSGEVSILQYFSSVAFVQGVIGYEFIDGVYWTLFVELVFYGWVYLVLLFGVNARMGEVARGWLLLSIVFLFFDFDGVIASLLLVNWACYFCLGLFLYELLVERRWSISQLTFVLLALFICLFRVKLRTEHVSLETGVGLSVLLAQAVFCLGVSFLVCALLHAPNCNQIIKRVCVVLGAVSYPLYLLHQEIGYLLLTLLDDVNGGGFVSLVLVYVSLCLFCVVVVEVYESFMAQVLRKYILFPIVSWVLDNTSLCVQGVKRLVRGGE